MSDVRSWLDSIGLVRYAEAFENNEIDWDVIPDLNHAILRDIGVHAAGTRMRILKAIEAHESAPENAADDDVMPQGGGSEAERRQLTVMFCDLVGSTAMSESMDPEDLRKVIGGYQSAATSVIELYGGYVARYMGDGLLIYFGYPQAHEDDAERAVRAGLGLIDAVAEVSSFDGARLQVRVGIATGLVVVGDLVGEGSSEERAALGETPNLAARLQAVAEPATVVIADSTRRLVEGRFDFETLPVQKLKGISSPVPVYRPTGIGDRSRFAAVHHGTLGQLVGRDEEVAILCGRWKLARGGEGQVVLLGGEPGIGKSRLTEALRSQIAPTEHDELSYQCSPYHGNSPFWPVVRELETRAGFTPRDDSATKLDKLEALLETTGQRTDRVCALIADLLSLPLERYVPLALTPQRQKDETIVSLERHFALRSMSVPLLVIIEDAHWIDSSTAELISAVIDGIVSQSTLVIITHRAEFDLPWRVQGSVTQLSLSRLGRKSTAAIVEGLLGKEALSGQVLGQIIERSQGVPLFAEELSKNFLESQQPSAHNRSQAPDPSTLLSVPSTLQDSLMERLDRLGPSKEVAQLCAVLGRQFSFALLSAMSNFEPSQLTQALERLVESGLLSQRGRPPQATYIFRHALLQDAAYNSLLKATRTELHAQVAHHLVEHRSAEVESEPELIAHHCSRGGLAEEAIGWWRQAAERAVARSAFAEAITNYESAISEIDGVVHRRGAQVPEDTLRQAVDLRLALRSAIVAGGNFVQALDWLYQAQALAKSLDDADRMGRIAVFLSVHFYGVGQYPQTITHAKHALTLATSQKRVGLQAEANCYMGFAHYLQGDFKQGLDCFRRAHALSGEPAIEWVGPLIPPSIHAYAWSAQCYAELGQFDQGIVSGIEGKRIADALGRPLCIFGAYRGLGTLYLRKGDLEPALSVLAQAVDVCREIGSGTYLLVVAPALGAVYTLLGRSIEAIALLSQTVDEAQALGITSQQAMRLVYLGEAYLAAGNFEEAMKCAHKARAVAQVHHERGHLAYALHLLGSIARSTGYPERSHAQEYYENALAHAVELGMRPLQAHCHRGLGALSVEVGRMVRAREQLGAAVKMYQAMEMSLWLPETTGMLKSAGGDGTTARPVP